MLNIHVAVIHLKQMRMDFTVNVQVTLLGYVQILDDTFLGAPDENVILPPFQLST